MDTAPPLRQPGDLVNGRYNVIKMLGKGATGEVYTATDTAQDGRQIAIKYLKGLSQSALDHFKDEFSTLTHLSHPNIARVYDFEQDEAALQFFFTSELVEGRDFMTATQMMSPGEIEELFVQALRALEYLHGNGIFHFDIKAANLLVEGNKVKLIDFGLATIRFQGKLVGTPSYMAPEMVRCDNPDGRADLYSLGVMAYAALAGINPFRTTKMEDTLDNQLKLIPNPPSAFNKEIPPYLDIIIMRLLEKRREDRYQTAAQVIHELSLRSPKKYAIETEETQVSYIPWESKFIGRREELEKVKTLLSRASSAATVAAKLALPNSRASSAATVAAKMILITGAEGSGRSRLATEIKHLAQVMEWTTFFLNDPAHFDEWRKDVTENRTQPMLVGIDDAHIFAEELWGRNIEEVCDVLLKRHDVPIILLVIGDEKYKPAFACPPSPDTGVLRIKLSNFSVMEVKEYLATVTGLSNPPEKLVTEVHSYTGGNPYLVTEVIKALVISGMLVDAQGRWRESTFEDIKVDMDRLQLSPTLANRLIKDYLALPTDTRPIVELMAVLARPINAADVKKLTGLPAKVITQLTRSGMIKSAAGTYFFSHPLTAKAVYGQMSEKDRMLWHDKIASLMVSPSNHEQPILRQAQDERLRPWPPRQGRQACPERSRRAQDDSEDVLYHTGRGSSPEAAKAALEKLIDIQVNAHHNYDAIKNASVYLEKWQGPEITLTLAKLYNRIGKYDLAIKTVEAFVGVAGGGEGVEVSALGIIGLAHLRQMNFKAARDNFLAALQIASNMSLSQQIRIENFLAEVSYYEGKIDQAVEIYERTAEMALNLPDEEQLNIRNNSLGQAYFQKGDYKKATEQLEKELALHRMADDKRLIARIQYMLAESYRMERLFEKSEQTFHSLVGYAKERDDLEHLFRAYNGLGNLYNNFSKAKEAIAYYERAWDIASRLGMEEQALLCLINLGIISSDLGDYKKAYEYLSSALAYLEGTRTKGGITKQYHCRVHLELGEVCRLNKKFDEAKQHLKDAEQMAATPAAKTLIFWIKLTWLKLARDTGDTTLAEKLSTELKTMADTEEKRAELEKV